MIKKDELVKLNDYFNALNYLSCGQLYLLDNPLLKRKLQMYDIKNKVVGHFGTVPAQNFIYTHLNRIIKKYDLDLFYISGPGHGGEAMVSQAYLDGVYSEIYPNITLDEAGMKKLFKQFSFPKGISSHADAKVPGSIHEGGELGYSLAHAYGAVLDNPDLIVCCCVGDGEAETGPLAASWHCNKLINPKIDGTVLPILNLNGYKIANPTILGRMSNEELISYFTSMGYHPYIVSGSDINVHKKMANVLDKIVLEIKEIKKSSSRHIMWPMVILKTPKGWTGPKLVGGKMVENSFRSHQIPLTVDKLHPENLEILEKWLKSYKPERLFDENGVLKKRLRDMLPVGDKRISANIHTNGGLLLKELDVPNFEDYAVKIKRPGQIKKEDMRCLGKFVRDIIVRNPDNFKVFGPDEALSNRLNAIFDVTKRKWNDKVLPTDEDLASDGKIIDSILSEHVVEGMLEGYILTGRHGFMHSYEAFIRIVDSMASQHAKWLKVCNELYWREDIASLNYVLTSHIWQQDHNGYTHQDPGFLNHLATKKADIVRMYLPIDANTLICCFDHIIKTKNYINVVVASKHPSYQWLDMDKAKELCKEGAGILDFASCDGKCDVVLAGCGDTPTLEVLACKKLLTEYVPSLKVRVVSVIDLMKLDSKHPHGLSDLEYDKLFTVDKPIIFAFHGYPNLIHELTYKRKNRNLHVHGYMEEGAITTPFDMRVINKIDRYHLALDVMKYVKDVHGKDTLCKYCYEMLDKHDKYIAKYGIDMKEVRDFKWND